VGKSACWKESDSGSYRVGGIARYGEGRGVRGELSRGSESSGAGAGRCRVINMVVWHSQEPKEMCRSESVPGLIVRMQRD
jgi:hypothetical protein